MAVYTRFHQICLQFTYDQIHLFIYEESDQFLSILSDEISSLMNPASEDNWFSFLCTIQNMKGRQNTVTWKLLSGPTVA